MDGDVNKSIYSFRLAALGCFRKINEQYGERNGAERIILAENFLASRA